MAKEPKKLDDLFHDTLKDILCGEEDSGDPAENGKGRAEPGTQGGIRKTLN
jgi:hypothetical protein